MEAIPIGWRYVEHSNTRRTSKRLGPRLVQLRDMAYQQTGDTAKLVGAMMRLRHNTTFKVKYVTHALSSRDDILVPYLYHLLQQQRNHNVNFC